MILITLYWINPIFLKLAWINTTYYWNTLHTKTTCEQGPIFYFPVGSLYRQVGLYMTVKFILGHNPIGKHRRPNI